MRNPLRVASVLFLIFLAVSLPVVWSGYSELRQARDVSSYVEAAEHYRAAARRIPWRPDLYELAGHAYYHAELYALADAAYQKAFRRGALSAEGWVAWGDVNYLDQKPQRAAELWEQGLHEPNPSEKLYSRLAQTYQENKQYSKAAQSLQNYVLVHADDAPARYRLGLLLTLSDRDAALSELINASQLDPQFDPAVQTLRTALNLASLNDSPSMRLVITGRGLGLVEEWELARAAFEEAVKLDENNAEAWAWLGEAEQHTAGDEAFLHLEKALDLNPESATVRGLRGLYFQRVGNNRAALDEFQAAARSEPENPAWMVSIGESYSKLGDLILALEAYQYAVTLAPEQAEYYRLLAGYCAQNNINIRDVGVPAAQKAVQLAPEDPLALDVLGWLLLLDGRHFEAERILLQAVALDPQLASAHFHLALLYFQTDNRAAMYAQLIQARDLGSAEAGNLLEQYFP
ncbi:MAG: tetratricopeptide repeat protein [Anaerolineae bacterium]|nr:tetratricopeptide repeat protein [Anaerolineae bacterium]